MSHASLNELATQLKLTSSAQIETLSALAGMSQPTRIEKGLCFSISALIKLAFFVSYGFQTMNGNTNWIGLVWTGCVISGLINAILGGSVDQTVRRSVRGVQHFFNGDTENLKENLFMIVLICAAVYLGYAQSGPFAKGTQAALASLTPFNAESTLSKIVTSSTAAAEALFLTNKALQFFGINIGEYWLPDKKKARLIHEADQPFQCVLDAENPEQLLRHVQAKVPGELEKKLLAGSFIAPAYLLTMASSTQDFVKNLPLYQWLDALSFKGLPLGYAALNFTALFTYNGFVRDGFAIVTNPLTRLFQKYWEGKDFFAEKDKHFVLDPEKANAWKYWAHYLFTIAAAALTYTSSIERAKAGYHETQALIDFCNNYALPIMAMAVNGFAGFHLIGAGYRIGTCTTQVETVPFEGADYRALRQTLTYLEEHPSHPFWTATTEAELLTRSQNAYHDARPTVKDEELQPLLRAAV